MPSPDPPLPKRQRAPGDTPKESPKPEVPSPANDAGEMPFESEYIRPDFARWAALAHWEPHEAACLSCNVDPRHFPEGANLAEGPLDDLSDRIWFRAQAIRRAVDIGRLEQFVAPLDALNVLDDAGARYPPELRDIAESIRPNKSLTAEGPGRRGCQTQAKSAGNTLHGAPSGFLETTPGQTKQIATLRKILLAVAIEKYQFRPERGNNISAGRIRETMIKHGLPIDADTIRNHLKEAVEEHWDGGPE